MTSHVPPPCSSPPASSSAPAPAFVPAAALLGITGAMIGQGHDALALTLGLAGGAYLWATGLVPCLPSGLHGGGLAGYLARRYESPLVGYVASVALGLAFLLLLAAELTALTATIAALTTYLPFGSFGPVVIILLLATLAVARLSHNARLPRASTIALALTLLALIIALAALSGPDGLGVAVSTPTLAEIGALERGLLEKRLADPAVFRPFASPFLRLDLANTLAIITCLALGTAILAAARIGSPGRQQATVSSPIRALMLVVAPLMMIPALAAAARRTLLAVVDAGLKAGSLPGWLASLQTSGAATICNAPIEAGPVALAKACGKGVGPEGLMRWQDISFAPDSLLVAVLSSLPGTVLVNTALGLILLAAAAATIATAQTAAATLHAAFVHPDDTAAPNGWSRFALIVLLWIFAALFTATTPAPAATLLVWAASIAAAGLAPVVIASALPRPSRAAALAAIFCGASLVLALTLTTRYDAMDALAVSTAYEPMPPPALRKMTTLFTSLGVASEERTKSALLAQIETLARDNISWIGLKPVAAGAWGLLLAAAIMGMGQALASGIGRLTRR